MPARCVPKDSFIRKYPDKFGLRIVDVDPATGNVKTMECMFCRVFGRGDSVEADAERKRKRTSSIFTVKAPFNTGHIRRHLRQQHPKKFEVYDALSSTEKKQSFFVQENHLALNMMCPQETSRDMTNFPVIERRLHATAEATVEMTDFPVIERRAHARVGLVGNPSDGFFGKTIAVALQNFYATVKLTEKHEPGIHFIPHPKADPLQFCSFQDLHTTFLKSGYQGGLVLLQATCKRFYEMAKERNIHLSERRGFTLSYDTNIPRQVGLAGSSAIITATFKCLVDFFHIDQATFPIPLRPAFVLSVEVGELGINAGLQDRVIQTYDGCMFMDFAENFIKSRGYGQYQRLPVENLPLMWLAYDQNPSNSGKIHADVKGRWERGEEQVLEAMKAFARLTDGARDAIIAKQYKDLAEIMQKNFELRRKIYGDACLGERNLRMVQIASDAGFSSAKFSGSGGAVVGICETESDLDLLERAFGKQGFAFARLQPLIGSLPGTEQ